MKEYPYHAVVGAVGNEDASIRREPHGKRGIHQGGRSSWYGSPIARLSQNHIRNSAGLLLSDGESHYSAAALIDHPKVARKFVDSQIDRAVKRIVSANQSSADEIRLPQNSACKRARTRYRRGILIPDYPVVLFFRYPQGSFLIHIDSLGVGQGALTG